MKTKLVLSTLTAFFLFLFSFEFLPVSEAAVPGKVYKDNILEAYGKLPLYFIENKGQLDPRVRFYVKRSGQTVYFTDEKIVFDFLRGEAGAVKDTGGAKKERLVFNLGFENVQKGVLLEGLDRQDAGVSYFVGNHRSQWKTGVSTYKGIIYQGIYKGIDLKIFGNGKDLEYEFIVNPGGNPDHILLSYNGIERLTKSGKGELLIGTVFRELRETRPFIYQEIEGKKVVGGGFEIRRSVGRVQAGKFSYGFQIAAYNPSYPLIIDPTLSYATYLGGKDHDIGNGIAVDGSGNAYITGYTWSNDFPTQNPYQGTFAGGQEDAFITKLSPSGNALVYSTYLGGNSTDYGHGIAVDGSGNAYVAGVTYSYDFPMQNPFQGENAGAGDVFIAKLSPSGNALAYSTFLGGWNTDSGHGIAVDGSGNAYVTGETISKDFPTQNAYQKTLAGHTDAFITKLSPSGNVLTYSTFLGGESFDYGYGIAIDGAGNAYVTGQTICDDFPTKNPYQENRIGYPDAFVTKLSASGSALVYSTFLGGRKGPDVYESAFNFGYGIAVNASGNAYVTGKTDASDFPTQNPYQGTYGGGDSDAFITKLSASGSALVYSTYLGGKDLDEGNGIAVDASGNACVTGFTKSGDFPTKNPYQETLAGRADAFITKLSPSGNALAYSTYLGAAKSDSGNGIAVDGSGNAYVTGHTASDDFPTQNPYQGTRAGMNDAFVTKLIDTTPQTTPVPDIKANAQDDPLIVSPGALVSIDISLDPGNKAGQNADWWVVEATPSGTLNYFDLNTVSMVPGLLPTYQGPLFGFGITQLLNSSDLTVGSHIFCFGVDLNMNDSLNADALYYDCVTVSVTEQ